MAGSFCGETGEEHGKLKNPQKVEGECKEEGKEEPDHGGGLELEPPAKRLTGSPEYDQKPGQRKEGDQYARPESDSFSTCGGAAFSGNLNEMKRLQGEDREDAGHDIQNQSPQEGE
jgi:hypothetical protein